MEPRGIRPFEAPNTAGLFQALPRLREDMGIDPLIVGSGIGDFLF